MDADASVLDALSLMSTHGVSSVAVLRGDRNVLGNISMTDVKVTTDHVYFFLIYDAKTLKSSIS